MEGINRCGGKVVAVDVPSGVHSDTGEILGAAVRADLTVTFAYRKRGLLLYPGAACAGETVLKKIGIRAGKTSPADTVYCLESSDLKVLPKRDASGNKGTFRKLLIIAGCDTICGAGVSLGKGGPSDRHRDGQNFNFRKKPDGSFRVNSGSSDRFVGEGSVLRGQA